MFNLGLDIDSFSTKCEGSEFDLDFLCQELNEVAARAYPIKLGYAFF